MGDGRPDRLESRVLETATMWFGTTLALDDGTDAIARILAGTDG
jgi:hypothetical protein